jgi:hypothetical protein
MIAHAFAFRPAGAFPTMCLPAFALVALSAPGFPFEFALKFRWTFAFAFAFVFVFVFVLGLIAACVYLSVFGVEVVLANHAVNLSLFAIHDS